LEGPANGELCVLRPPSFGRLGVDNVPESFLVEVLTEMSGISDPVRLQMAANTVALMARTLSYNPNHDSPFSQNARKLNLEASGGKPDDVTVLLASVV